MSIYDHPIQNPREYPCGPPRQYRGEPAKCRDESLRTPLLRLALLVLALGLASWLNGRVGEREAARKAAMPERTAGR